MKFICIGRNYAAHAAELNNEVPGEPVIFLKPDSATLRPGYDFYIPDFTQEVHYEIEMVLRIDKAGKFIDERFALKYINQITVGIDFTARDLQDKLKSKGLPWEKAKAFDGSAALGNWISFEGPEQIRNAEIELKINGELRQKGNTSMMLFPPEKIISEVSKYFTLKKGDMIFTGTPAGVGPVQKGDLLEGFFKGQKLLDLKIR